MSSQYKIKLNMMPDLEVPLCQQLFWFDKNHVASVDHYKKFVFESGKVLKGQFVEFSLGQEQLKEIKEEGLSAHSKYGTYLLLDDDAVAIKHIHGRRFRDDKDNETAEAVRPARRDKEAEKLYRKKERQDENRQKKERMKQKRRAMLEALSKEERAEFIKAEKNMKQGAISSEACEADSSDEEGKLVAEPHRTLEEAQCWRNGENWSLSVFYSCVEDQRVWVPKNEQVTVMLPGWFRINNTLNFAHKESWAFLGAVGMVSLFAFSRRNVQTSNHNLVIGQMRAWAAVGALGAWAWAGSMRDQ